MKNSVQTGKVISLADSVLTKPSHTSTLCAAGDPVKVGVLVGVAYNTPTVTTDLVDVQTEGVFNLAVVGDDGTDPAAIALGDLIYCGAAAILNVDTTGAIFGIALAAVGSGDTTTIPVKVTGFRV